MGDNERFCCDDWWSGLTQKQKEYIHYFFYDIKRQPLLSDEDIHEMHESRFILEGYDRK